MAKGPDLNEKYYLLKEISKQDRQSQRELAKSLGISLGKLNFILKALVEKGLIKMENFAQSQHKIQYRYILTSEGLKEKIKITQEFIKRKELEFERLRLEIEDAKDAG